ncbi:hypothetical protein DE4576_05409 [Mycobacterium marinum]|nr:hypothetical protein DE4576_05409 [Mycobacterium marinum]
MSSCRRRRQFGCPATIVDQCWLIPTSPKQSPVSAAAEDPFPTLHAARSRKNRRRNPPPRPETHPHGHAHTPPDLAQDHKARQDPNHDPTETPTTRRGPQTPSATSHPASPPHPGTGTPSPPPPPAQPSCARARAHAYLTCGGHWRPFASICGGVLHFPLEMSHFPCYSENCQLFAPNSSSKMSNNSSSDSNCRSLSISEMSAGIPARKSCRVALNKRRRSST